MSGRTKYLCAARYTGAKCGGRVRTYGSLCGECADEVAVRKLYAKMRRR